MAPDGKTLHHSRHRGQTHTGLASQSNRTDTRPRPDPGRLEYPLAITAITTNSKTAYVLNNNFTVVPNPDTTNRPHSHPGAGELNLSMAVTAGRPTICLT